MGEETPPPLPKPANPATPSPMAAWGVVLPPDCARQADLETPLPDVMTLAKSRDVRFHGAETAAAAARPPDGRIELRPPPRRRRTAPPPGADPPVMSKSRFMPPLPPRHPLGQRVAKEIARADAARAKARASEACAATAAAADLQAVLAEAERRRAARRGGPASASTPAGGRMTAAEGSSRQTTHDFGLCPAILLPLGAVSAVLPRATRGSPSDEADASDGDDGRPGESGRPSSSRPRQERSAAPPPQPGQAPLISSCLNERRGTVVATCGRRLLCWNPAQPVGTPPQCRDLPSGTVTTALAYSSAGDLLVSVRDGVHVALHSGRTLAPVGRAQPTGAGGRATALAASGCHRCVVLGHPGEALSVWRVHTPDASSGEAGASGFGGGGGADDGGGRLYRSGAGSGIRLQQVDLLRLPDAVESRWVACLVLTSAPGSKRPTDGNDGAKRPLPSGPAAASAARTTYNVSNADVLPWAVAAAGTGVIVWDLAHRCPVLRLSCLHDLAITSLTVDPSWSRLATGSQDRTVRLWELKRDVIEAALAGVDPNRRSAGEEMATTARPTLAATLVGHADGVTGVHWEPPPPADERDGTAVSASNGRVARGSDIGSEDGESDDPSEDDNDKGNFPPPPPRRLGSARAGAIVSVGAEGTLRYWDGSSAECWDAVGAVNVHAGGTSECGVSTSGDERPEFVRPVALHRLVGLPVGAVAVSRRTRCGDEDRAAELAAADLADAGYAIAVVSGSAVSFVQVRPRRRLVARPGRPPVSLVSRDGARRPADWPSGRPWGPGFLSLDEAGTVLASAPDGEGSQVLFEPSAEGPRSAAVVGGARPQEDPSGAAPLWLRVLRAGAEAVTCGVVSEDRHEVYLGWARGGVECQPLGAEAPGGRHRRGLGGSSRGAIRRGLQGTVDLARPAPTTLADMLSREATSSGHEVARRDPKSQQLDAFLGDDASLPEAVTCLAVLEPAAARDIDLAGLRRALSSLATWNQAGSQRRMRAQAGVWRKQKSHAGKVPPGSDDWDALGDVDPDFADADAPDDPTPIESTADALALVRRLTCAIRMGIRWRRRARRPLVLYGTARGALALTSRARGVQAHRADAHPSPVVAVSAVDALSACVSASVCGEIRIWSVLPSAAVPAGDTAIGTALKSLVGVLVPVGAVKLNVPGGVICCRFLVRHQDNRDGWAEHETGGETGNRPLSPVGKAARSRLNALRPVTVRMERPSLVDIASGAAESNRAERRRVLTGGRQAGAGASIKSAKGGRAAVAPLAVPPMDSGPVATMELSCTGWFIDCWLGGGNGDVVRATVEDIPQADATDLAALAKHLTGEGLAVPYSLPGSSPVPAERRAAPILRWPGPTSGPVHGQPVVAIAATRAVAASADGSGLVVIWDCTPVGPGGRLRDCGRLELRRPVTRIAFSGPRSLALACANGALVDIDVPAGAWARSDAGRREADAVLRRASRAAARAERRHRRDRSGWMIPNADGPDLIAGALARAQIEVLAPESRALRDLKELHTQCRGGHLPPRTAARMAYARDTGAASAFTETADSDGTDASRERKFTVDVDEMLEADDRRSERRATAAAAKEMVRRTSALSQMDVVVTDDDGDDDGSPRRMPVVTVDHVGADRLEDDAAAEAGQLAGRAGLLATALGRLDREREAGSSPPGVGRGSRVSAAPTSLRDSLWVADHAVMTEQKEGQRGRLRAGGMPSSYQDGGGRRGAAADAAAIEAARARARRTGRAADRDLLVGASRGLPLAARDREAARAVTAQVSPTRRAGREEIDTWGPPTAPPLRGLDHLDGPSGALRKAVVYPGGARPLLQTTLNPAEASGGGPHGSGVGGIGSAWSRALKSATLDELGAVREGGAASAAMRTADDRKKLAKRLDRAKRAAAQRLATSAAPDEETLDPAPRLPPAPRVGHPGHQPVLRARRADHARAARLDAASTAPGGCADSVSAARATEAAAAVVRVAAADERRRLDDLLDEGWAPTPAEPIRPSLRAAALRDEGRALLLADRGGSAVGVVDPARAFDGLDRIAARMRPVDAPPLASPSPKLPPVGRNGRPLKKRKGKKKVAAKAPPLERRPGGPPPSSEMRRREREERHGAVRFVLTSVVAPRADDLPRGGGWLTGERA